MIISGNLKHQMQKTRNQFRYTKTYGSWSLYYGPISPLAYKREYLPELWRGHPGKIGDVVTVWGKINLQRTILYLSFITITWEAVITFCRLVPHLFVEVPRSPRITCGWVLSLCDYLINFTLRELARPTFGKYHGMQLSLSSAPLITHSSRQLENV